MRRLLASSATARDLARLLAGWLVVIVLVQAVAAAQGLVMGARHRHAAAAADAAGGVSIGMPIPVAVDHHHNHHHHDAGERHLHTGADADGATSVAALGDDTQDLGAAAGALLIALGGLPPAAWPAWQAAGMHVLHAAPAWQPAHAWARTPERPPRA